MYNPLKDICLYKEDTMNAEHNSNHLKRDIGFITALSIVIGTVIGSGVFMKPGEVLASSGNAKMALFAWLLGGLITLASGLTVAEVGAQIPKTGGLYIYLEETYGKFWGYLCGWVQTVVYGPAVIAALGLYLGSLIVHLFGLDESWLKGIGIGFVVLLMLVNITGTKYGGWVQNISTAAKLIPIVLIIIFGLWKGEQSIFTPGAFEPEEFSFGAAVLATLFAYDGWILVGSVAGEMKNPTRLLPKVIFIGLAGVTVVYLLVNMALLYVLPAEDIVKLGENAASTAATTLFGDFGGILITIGIIISIFGCLNGKMMAFPRIPYAMAKNGQLPFSKGLGKVHPKFHTPYVSIISQAAIATVFMLISDPNRLSDISVFSIYLFYIFAFFAVFTLRRRNSGKERPYSVPLYPLVPLVAIVGSIYIIVSMLQHDPVGGLGAIFIMVIGLPVYYFLKRRATDQV